MLETMKVVVTVRVVCPNRELFLVLANVNGKDIHTPIAFKTFHSMVAGVEIIHSEIHAFSDVYPIIAVQIIKL